jgi:hypothetical protein
MPSHTFDEMTARIAAEPTHREVKIPLKPIDLSIKGVLDRIQTLAADAHQRGDIAAADFEEIKTAAAKLRGVFTRVDESHLIRRAQHPIRPR